MQETVLDVRCGEAISLLRALEANSVDLIIADPPYNLGKDYGNGSDNKDKEVYLSFSLDWLTACHRVLKPGGTLYVFMGVRFISYIYDILENRLNMSFQSWVTWHYTQGLGKRKAFSPRHDDVLVFSKDMPSKFNLDAVRVPQKYYRARNNMRGANPGDVWQFSHVHYSNPNRQDHPTQKPEGLIERMVLASSDEGDLIVDPFLGSGTTARVCQVLKRNCTGFELNSGYVEQIKARLAQPFTGFDSLDPRMQRVPNDLTDPDIRTAYLKNHIGWFLKNNPKAIATFKKAVIEKYGKDAF